MKNLNRTLDPARHWGWLLASGVFAVLLGAFAVAKPMTSSLEIEFLIGLILVASGVSHVVLAIVMRAHDGFWGRLLLGVGAIAVGVFILRAPLTGLLSLTLLLAGYFLFEGAVRIVDAVRARDQKGWGWTLVSGVSAAVLGVLIFNAWPVEAAWAIGLLVGINLMIGGATTIGIAVAAVNEEDTIRDRFEAAEAAMAA